MASLIYDHDDYAGLFMIKERIKQIIHRLKNHYKVSVNSKNYRAYIDKDYINQIHIKKLGPLRIENNFSLQMFMEFYEISQSKAKIQMKRLLSDNIVEKRLVGKKNIYTKK